jgi:hypothetical protein
MDRMPELVTVSNTRWRRDPTQPTRRTSTGLTGPLGYGALPSSQPITRPSPIPPARDDTNNKVNPAGGQTAVIR